MRTRRLRRVEWLSLLAVEMVDVPLTWWALRHGAHESNPLGRSLFALGGVAAILLPLLFKSALVAGIVRVRIPVLAWAVTATMLAVAASNVWMLTHLGPGPEAWPAGLGR